MSGGNELLPVGQCGNYKKLVETATSSVVAEMTAAWLQPSTEVVGLVGGNTVLVTVNLAPTTSGAYAAGDLIGGQISIDSVFRSTTVMTGLLQSIALTDKTTQQASIDFVLFHTATTGTTYTNDVAFALADADLAKVIGGFSLYNSDYMAFSDNGMATVRSLGLPVKATTGTGLTAAAINRSTGPSYTSTGDLAITLGFLVD